MMSSKDNQNQISEKNYIVLSIGEYHDDIWKVDKIIHHENHFEFIITLLENNPEDNHYTFDYPIIYIININKLDLIYCSNYRINKLENGAVELILKVYLHKL